jgi:hypothetical protein
MSTSCVQSQFVLQQVATTHCKALWRCARSRAHLQCLRTRGSCSSAAQSAQLAAQCPARMACHHCLCKRTQTAVAADKTMRKTCSKESRSLLAGSKLHRQGAVPVSANAQGHLVRASILVECVCEAKDRVSRAHRHV